MESSPINSISGKDPLHPDCWTFSQLEYFEQYLIFPYYMPDISSLDVNVHASSGTLTTRSKASAILALLIIAFTTLVNIHSMQAPGQPILDLVLFGCR